MKHRTGRRAALCCGGALAAAGLFGWLSRETAPALTEGWRHPCRGALPGDLRDHDLVHRAFDGLNVSALWDCHAHLLGTGDSGSGCTVNAAMQSPWHPVESLRRRAILDAACVDSAAASIDRAYVARCLALTQDFPPGARWLLFAFEQACDDAGQPREDWTTFHVPNRYAAEVAARHPERFGWVASVHPYRPDALERLDTAIAAGALALKWLPSAMNIDAGDPRCKPFYDRLARAKLPLIVHCGEEQAVPGAGRETFGSPLRLRAALAAGVRVILAHAASLGRAEDLDRRSAPQVPAFDLFTRMMDESEWQDRLLADISAVFQSNRRIAVQRRLLQRADWHPRLLHGSDHPLPGMMPLYAPARLAAAGLLDPAAVEPLRRIREHNPLLFDLVQKRALRDGSARLATEVFETRRHFEPALATVRN